MTLPFADRAAAGHALADRLEHLGEHGDLVVLALPRGGVPVAVEIARRLGAPLDVLVVRKLGVPWHPELAVGALASGGVRVLNQDVITNTGVSPADIEVATRRELAEMHRRERDYRGGRAPAEVAGRVAIIVDDGLATGATAAAAVHAVRAREPATVVLAVPVGTEDTVRRLADVADDVVCVATPEPFVAVGRHYRDFREVADEQVREMLGSPA